MERKEAYRNNLPHFQQPGQSYFVSCCLKSAVPPKTLASYRTKLETLKNEIAFLTQQNATKDIINLLKSDYQLYRRRYIKAFDDLLHLQTEHIINLYDESNRKIMFDAFLFWEGNKIENVAFCIMPNHFHWVFHTKKVDKNGNPVYLQDILHSVKGATARKINRLAKRSGRLWQQESFDTTIQNRIHMHNVVEYTLNNPVAANYVQKREDWKGNWEAMGWSF